MISIETVVYTVLYLLGVGLIFALLAWLIRFVAAQFPFLAPFAKIAYIVLAVCAVLILIGVILSLMGHPVVRW